MINKSTAVIVLNWNGIEDTKKCLESLQKQSTKDFDIILIDNGSTDSSCAEIKHIKQTNLIKIFNDNNLGFAGGVNAGLSHAIKKGYKYCILFNNDAIADKKWVENLVKAANAKPDAGIITGLFLNRDGKTIDSTGDFYSSWGMPFPRERNKPTKSASKSGYVFGATGGASLYKASMLEKIGLFDETFFAYFEDVDISFRAQLAGYKVFYTNQAIAYHEQGSTAKKISGFATQQTFKNLPLLFWKNVPLGLLLPIGLRLLLLYWLLVFNAIRKGRGKPALKGVLAGLKLTFTSALPKRRSIQKDKIVSSSYIKSIIYRGIPQTETGILRRLKFKT